MRGGLRWFLLGYAGIGGFFVLEATTRKPGRASSLEASSDDQDTTRLIVMAYAVAVTLAPVLRSLPSPRLPPLTAQAGLALEAAGLGLRAWSMRTLGQSYSRTLRLEEAQALVDAGPYRLVRHPGYAGSLLIWTGFALTSRSPAVLVLIGGLLIRAYQRRIAAEEALLLHDLPAYRAYSDRTWRLIPFLW